MTKIHFTFQAFLAVFLEVGGGYMLNEQLGVFGLKVFMEVRILSDLGV